MTDRPKNIQASIHARLANEAKKRGRPFNEILQYYGMERFLYRLSKTKYKNSFVLKGGLVFYSLDIPLRRPTKDIDFLSALENRRELIAEVIRAAIAISVPDDGVFFDPDSIDLASTQVNADRNGIRAVFLGYLGKAQIPMQIDFGFSDELTIKPTPIDYPVLLKESARPRLVCYPVESIVAEKLHAIERFAAVPSRWQDFYDIWLISQNFEVDDQSLAGAIARTYENRSATLPIGRPPSLTEDFAATYQGKWEGFLRRSGLENPQIQLVEVVRRLWKFLERPILVLKTSRGARDHRLWIPGDAKWR